MANLLALFFRLLLTYWKEYPDQQQMSLFFQATLSKLLHAPLSKHSACLFAAFLIHQGFNLKPQSISTYLVAVRHFQVTEGLNPTLRVCGHASNTSSGASNNHRILHRTASTSQSCTYCMRCGLICLPSNSTIPLHCGPPAA